MGMLRSAERETNCPSLSRDSVFQKPRFQSCVEMLTASKGSAGITQKKFVLLNLLRRVICQTELLILNLLLRQVQLMRWDLLKMGLSKVI